MIVDLIQPCICAYSTIYWYAFMTLCRYSLHISLFKALPLAVVACHVVRRTAMALTNLLRHNVIELLSRKTATSSNEQVTFNVMLFWLVTNFCHVKLWCCLARRHTKTPLYVFLSPNCSVSGDICNVRTHPIYDKPCSKPWNWGQAWQSRKHFHFS